MAWLNTNLVARLRFTSLLPLVAIVFYNDFRFLFWWGIVYLVLFYFRKEEPQKKPFVYTARVKRLISLIVICTLLMMWGLSRFIQTDVFLFELFFLSILLFGFPYFLIAVNAVAVPVEKIIGKLYVKDAQRHIKELSTLKVIGITGSYGKTSSKFILQQLLSMQYNSLMTPESFNTLMGVTMVVREQLKPIHEFFIAEMGAKQKGDIKEICDLVHPGIALLTTIGQQHLETFKTLENIKETKSELVYSLPQTGIAFLNADDINQSGLEGKIPGRVIRYGIKNAQADYHAYDINMDLEGLTSFKIDVPGGGLIKLETHLLGTHNVYNILAAVSIAHELGVDRDKIFIAVRQLKPVPHRLNLKKLDTGIFILDDAFNSNPKGAASAIDVLCNLKGNRKIVITPGMVELGEIEVQENRKFGQAMSKCVDYVILVGKSVQTQAILEGLISEGYNENKVYVAKNFSDANQHYQSMLTRGDIVLYENDLPDTYNT